MVENCLYIEAVMAAEALHGIAGIQRCTLVQHNTIIIVEDRLYS